MVDTPCKTCDGKGKIRRQKTIEISVPAGIDDDQILNVGGKGNAGSNGGPNGDLHVYITVRPHAIFTRRGNDVWCDMPHVHAGCTRRGSHRCRRSTVR